jgi:hypothetical protein
MTQPTELQGRCHCGQVSWTYRGALQSATACNCTSCRKWGGLWAYGNQGDEITTAGNTQTYVRGPHLQYHFCPVCAAVAFWALVRTNEAGKRPMAVNLRLAEPDAIQHLPIDHFDGLVSFADLPRDARCVRDMWF